MNSMEALQRDIELAVPKVETKLRRPRKDGGNWWLDAAYDGHEVTIQWSPRRGFGITSGSNELATGYGEGPEEVFEDRETTAKRVIGLLKTKAHTLAPPEVVLRELRGLLGVTQDQLAGRLGVQQAAVSRLERRSDITLSSLRRYVAALGGKLEINIRTSNGEQVRLLDPKASNRRASCGHVEETLCDSDPLADPPPQDELRDWLDAFQSAARSRWDCRFPSKLVVHTTNVTGLASAETSSARVEINSKAASCLVRTFSRIVHASASNDATQDSRRAVFRYLLAHEVGHVVQTKASRSDLTDLARGHTHSELQADAIAGWLAGQAGDDPVGAVIAGLLGCRIPACTHPSPEQRSLAYLSGYFEGLQARRSAPATMNLVVVRVGDLEASRAFYTLLGLRFVQEKHDAGPLHYSCTLADMVMELYPRTKTAPSAPLRFGLRLASGSNALEKLCSSGLLREPPRILRTQPQSKVYLVKDPDEHSVELELVASTRRDLPRPGAADEAV